MAGGGAKAAVALCETWAAKVASELPCQLLIFGSAIYKDGEQFDDQSSDIDIVAIFPEPTDAIARVGFLEQLRARKAGPELELIPILSRLSCTEPALSIVPVTHFELRANIHKNASRSFFTKNIFYDLINKKMMDGIPNAGTLTVSDENRYAIEYVQRIRNAFLAISANGTGGIKAYEGPDPLPKELMRTTAQAWAAAPHGEWYDTLHGLDSIFVNLKSRQAEHSDIQTLYKRVSVRRGGRGKKLDLSPTDQLLLAELLFDQASSGATESVVDSSVT
jgi:hypothetical protein